jgi:GDP-mannose transporter
MSDKKNEDYAIRMPDSDREKDPFLGSGGRRSPPHRQLHSWTTSMSKIDNSPPLSILAYCLSSISMTVVNKYVVSGPEWNLNFFYLAVQVRCSQRCRAFICHDSDVSSRPLSVSQQLWHANKSD